MTEEQQQNLQAALEKLMSLKTDFENAATAVENDKSLWHRRFPKHISTGFIRKDLIRLTQETISKFESDDRETQLAGLRPLCRLFEATDFAVYAGKAHVEERFSRSKHQDRKDLTRSKDFDQKVKEIWDLSIDALTEDQQTQLQSRLFYRLRSLKADFESAAAAIEQDKSHWPRRFSKSIYVQICNNRAEDVQKSIEGFESKNAGQILDALLMLSESTGNSARLDKSNAEKRVSRFKHRDQKDAVQSEELDRKVKEVWALALKAANTFKP